MTTPTPPTVECEQIHAGLTVANLAAAIEFYTKKLGFGLGFTWGGEPPTFAGVNLGKTQIFLKEGTPVPNPGISSVFFVVGNADELYEFHRANGVEVINRIGDRDYGFRDYAVLDLDRYMLVFGHNIYAGRPKIRIERVDVPVRLEKRLAGLLMDLAAHKRMSVDSCLEEILLHTNEGVEPHTKSTLRYIEELNKKYGIDYDSHGSYRFVEE